MKRLDKILVVLDVDEEGTMLADKAAVLAERAGARLEIFVCCFSRSLVASHLFDPEGLLEGEKGFMHGQERRIEELIARRVSKSVSASGDVHWERDLEQGILQKIARYEPDLVIKSCRYHPLLQRALFGHLEGQLIRHCPRPLLLVKRRSWAATPRIMAAVDPLHDHDKPESLDWAIVDQARLFSHTLGGRLELFHSFQPLPASVIFDDTLVLDYEAFKEKLRVQHEDAMARLVADSGLNGDTPVHLVQGEPITVLPDYLEVEQADVVVMGAAERDGFDRLFVGNTAEDTLNRLDCDLLVVKAPEFKAPPVPL